MANNDRVTKTPAPSWIGDSQSSGKPLATKATNGSIGWNSDEKSRTLLTRDAFNTPGWRDKIVLPPGMATISYDETLFTVVDESTGEDVPSGGYIKKGVNIEVTLQAQGYEYGCYTEITNGALSSKHFLKNFTSPSDTEGKLPNSEVLQVLGNIQITGEAKKRGQLNIGADISGVITATLEVNSWGNKGHQVKTLNLIPSLMDPTDMEFYEGDSIKFTIAITAPYHWCNFRYSRGTNTTMYPVDKTLVTYTENGGVYTTTITDKTLYIAMGAVRPIKFYLYQEGSDNFDKVNVVVQRQNSNLVIYKQTGQPSVGTRITFGRNGVAKNHAPLYVGMTLRIKATINNCYICSNLTWSYTSLTPTPPVPDNISYLNPCDFTIGTEANSTGQVCVGLRYVKTNYKGVTCEVTINEADRDTFKNFRDAIYEQQQNPSEVIPYFKNKYHRVTNIATAKKCHSATQAIKLALMDPNDYSKSFRWSYKQDGTFQKESLVIEDENNNYFLEDNRIQTPTVNVGPFSTQANCYIVSGEYSTASNGDQIFTLTCVSDGIDVDIDGPIEDWFVPGSTTQYIPLATLEQVWGTQPWWCLSKFYVTPYFAAVVRSV